jgi:hypothetical protein
MSISLDQASGDEAAHGIKGSFYCINATNADALMQEISMASSSKRRASASHAPLPDLSSKHVVRRVSKQTSRDRREARAQSPPSRRSSVASLASYTALQSASPVAKCRSARKHSEHTEDFDIDIDNEDRVDDDISTIMSASDELYDNTADGPVPTPTELPTPQVAARRIINDITPVTAEMQTFRDWFLREAQRLEGSGETPKAIDLPVLSLADVEAELCTSGASSTYSPVPLDWSEDSSPKQLLNLAPSRLSGPSFE